jgi:hypothetical protein
MALKLNRHPVNDLETAPKSMKGRKKLWKSRKENKTWHERVQIAKGIAALMSASVVRSTGTHFKGASTAQDWTVRVDRAVRRLTPTVEGQGGGSDSDTSRTNTPVTTARDGGDGGVGGDGGKGGEGGKGGKGGKGGFISTKKKKRKRKKKKKEQKEEDEDVVKDQPFQTVQEKSLFKVWTPWLFVCSCVNSCLFLCLFRTFLCKKSKTNDYGFDHRRVTTMGRPAAKGKEPLRNRTVRTVAVLLI